MKKDLKKNVIDLEYNTYLTYLDVFFVIIGTIIITVWFAFNIWWSKDPIENVLFKVDFTLAMFTVGLIGYLLVKGKLDSLKKEIKKL